MKKVAYLLGSGISLKAGLPSTTAFTQAILNGSSFLSDGPGREKLQLFICLLEKLWYEYRGELELGYKEPNYEDIYYLAEQIDSALSDKPEFENPALLPILLELKSKLDLSDLLNLKYLAKEITEEIITYFCSTLENKHFHLSEAGKIEKTVFEVSYIDNLAIQESSEVEIFNLNNDLIIEQYSKSGPLTFTDGFTENKPDVWKPSLFDENYDVKLYKIHGSIDWQRDQSQGYTRFIRGGGDWKKRGVLPNEKIILIGTTNKMLGYHRGIFTELWARFYMSLMRNNKLIIAGYGFFDRAINNALIHWLDVDIRIGRRMLIIDPAGCEIKKRVSATWSLKWNEWLKEGRMKLISENIEDVERDSVLSWINCS